MVLQLLEKQANHQARRSKSSDFSSYFSYNSGWKIVRLTLVKVLQNEHGLYVYVKVLEMPASIVNRKSTEVPLLILVLHLVEGYFQCEEP